MQRRSPCNSHLCKCPCTSWHYHLLLQATSPASSHRCSLLPQMPHVAWYDCLSVWHNCKLRKKWLNQSRCGICPRILVLDAVQISHGKGHFWMGWHDDFPACWQPADAGIFPLTGCAAVMQPAAAKLLWPIFLLSLLQYCQHSATNNLNY